MKVANFFSKFWINVNIKDFLLKINNKDIIFANLFSILISLIYLYLPKWLIMKEELSLY